MADFIDPYAAPAAPPAPPDATVDSIVYDETTPGWVEVSFSDGSPPKTMPAEEAEALPKTAAAGGPAPYDATFGPPPDAVPPPGAPNALAQQWEAAGQDPFVQAAESHVAPPGFTAPPGRPTNPAAPAAPALRPGEGVGTGAPQPSMSEIVAPGSPGGAMAPAETTLESSQTTTEYAEAPEAAQARTTEAYAGAAEAAWVKDWNEYQAKYGQNIAAEFGTRAQREQVERLQLQARAEREAQERIVKAMDDTPINPDDFWNKSPGRSVAAWIAMALSGFLQGVTRGQNPALNQMTSALNAAQDRWLANARAERGGQYARREAAIRDARATEDSYRMQLSGLLSKEFDLRAQRAGIPVPPGLETYRKAQGVQAAEAMTRIGQVARGQATESVQQTLKAQAATGPVTRFDAERRAIGVDDKKHQEAMSPSVDLGGKVRAADEMRGIYQALSKIAAENGGQLPAQGTLSLTKLGLAPMAARLGLSDQVTTTQLLNQAALSYIAAIGNIKGLDSNVERERFETILNSGEASSTLRAIQERADFAEQSAVSTASGYAGGNAKRYVDLLRAQQSEAGSGGAAPVGFQPLGVRREGGTAPAGAPLPPAAAKATTGTYVRLKDRPPMPKASL